ncbi:MAG: hypothetical protein Q9213_000857 [Squamulea squamosa]
MTDFNPFEESSAFWDQFVIPLGLDDSAASDAPGFDLGTTPSSSSTYTAPHESKFQDQPEFADIVGPQGVHFNVSQRINDNPARFDNLADILQNDDFWKNIGNSPSLAELVAASPASDLVDTSYRLVSEEPLQSLLGAFQTPQLAWSPPQVALATPHNITPSGVPQHPDLRTQGSAPTEVTYQSPYLAGWLAANQFVHQEPDTAVSSQVRSRKRKAREYDDSDEDSMNMPTYKRRKTKTLNRTNPRKTTARQRLHTRTEVIERFDGSKVYDPLPSPPTNWSIFRYTSYGELQPGTFYSTAEIKYYLYNHPLHTLSNGIKSPKQGNLRLWIQRNPPDSKRRYPDISQSNRCRFKKCFATHNIINQGHLRLCFDELWHLNTEDFRTDPFHSAGYVHINCLERHLDFPQLCHDLPIMVDDREMPYEPRSRNLMSLDSQPLQNARLSRLASEFVEACNDKSLIGYPRGARPHEGTFVWRLTRVKVMTSSARKLAEEKGLKKSHAAHHLGDLEVEFVTRDLTRKPEYQHGRRIETTKSKARVYREWL